MDDKKVYEPGKVEISSQEYRDLVSEMVEARKDADKYRSDFWKKEDEVKKLKEENESLHDMLNQYGKFLHDKELTQQYKLFVMELKGVE